jgi:hypothetical protein
MMLDADLAALYRTAAFISALECFPVDDLDMEGQHVNVVNAPEVDPVVPWSRWPAVVGGDRSHRVEGSDPARSAEEVVHILVPELIPRQVLASFDLDIRWAQVVRGHDHPFADADGAVASSAARDLLAREPESDGITVAAGLIGLRRHERHPFTIESCLVSASLALEPSAHRRPLRRQSGFAPTARLAHHGTAPTPKSALIRHCSMM